MHRTMRIPSICAAALAFVLPAAWIGLQGRAVVGSGLFPAAVAVMAAAMMVLWRLKPSQRMILALCIPALISRLALLGFPASDDVNRYIWEGTIQAYGHNPFLVEPGSPELEPLRDENWTGINHKEYPTIYWPAAQLLFRAVARISPAPLAFKIVFLAFDLLVFALLFAFVRHGSGRAEHLVLYLFNPLILVFTAGEGHLEIVTVFFVMLALFWYDRRRWVLMYGALGLAIMTKLTPVIILPFLVTRRNGPFLPVLAVPALLFVPYIEALPVMLDVPLSFMREFAYNGLVYELGSNFYTHGSALTLCWICALLSMAVIFLTTPGAKPAARNALAVFLLCSPTVQPWYVQLMTPMLVLFPSGPWIVLHVTIIPLVFRFNPGTQRPFWHDQDLLQVLAYGPFLITAAAVFLKKALYAPPWQEEKAPPLFSVVIPVLNEENTIGPCIEAVQAQPVPVEIIVADGGSTDRTVPIARSYGAKKILACPRGRGVQIRRGAREAAGEIIAVVHADSRLLPDTFSRAARRMAGNPGPAGGACGAAYESGGAGLLFIRFLNSLRILLFGISFGDQVQFFRRDLAEGLVPEYVLMEDIEISLRLKEAGRTTFIPHGVVNSKRMWMKKGFTANFIGIVWLSTIFLAKRRLGLIRGDCSDFYRMYYG